MKVLHLATVDISHEKLLGDQYSEMIRRGIEVHATSAPGPYVGALQDRGVIFHPLQGSTRTMSLTSDLRAARSLRSLLREIKPDILHTHTPKPGVYGRLVGRSVRGVGVINTIHGLYAQDSDPLPKRLVWNGLERLAAFASHEELFQNSEDLKTYTKMRVPASKLTLLGNGVNLNKFAHKGDAARSGLRTEWAIRDDQVVVGVVGRLVGEKGFREIFEANRTLRQTNDKFVFVIIGPSDTSRSDGISQTELDEAKDQGCILLGHRDDIDELYSGMDLLLSASYREGFPRSVMEGSAAGLPILATNIRGTRDAVNNGHTGLLVEVRSGDALVAGLQTIVADQAQFKRLGEQGLVHAQEHFGTNRLVDITVGAYDTVIQRRKPTLSTAK